MNCENALELMNRELDEALTAEEYITGLGSPMPMEREWTCMLKPARNSS